jgi:hypothetical protein
MHNAHLTFILPVATFILIIGYLAWNYFSVKRNQETGGNTSGLGGPNDPIA